MAKAKKRIEDQKSEIKGLAKNLEEQAISLVGRDIYERLIKGYTKKQWGRDCKDLPAFIIKRLPVRLTFDNNYYANKFLAEYIRLYLWDHWPTPRKIMFGKHLNRLILKYLHYFFPQTKYFLVLYHDE